MKILSGYDTRGTVYDAGDFILRRSAPEHLNDTLKIFDCYRAYDLAQYGIVETGLNEADGSLRHRKHIISYPFEWTVNMLRDAALFHLELFLNLDRYELTLKDALPNNILFDFSRPVFVDFFSILFRKDLAKEKWLRAADRDDPRFAVFDIMFIPYMFIPIMALAERSYAHARRMLSERACNLGTEPPSWNDLALSKGNGIAARIMGCLNLGRLAGNINFRRFIYSKKQNGFSEFCRYLMDQIKDRGMSVPNSGYVSYYEDKDEKFDLSDQSGWGEKQRNIHDIIFRLRPGRVLDIGANTGWFSILAEQLGAEVISTDIDESSIDSLYLYSKINGLKILPLKLSFDELTREIFGVADKDTAYEGRDFISTPLYLSPLERLSSDMVLVLGLTHHLILGEGRSITSVFEILSKLAEKTLIVEFVGMDDEKIRENPSFFKNLDKFSRETYNSDLFISSGRKFFNEVKVLDSHPDSRRLLVFQR